MKRIFVLLGWAAPLFAQYAGPAILSRGDAPTAMASPQVSFRPFVEVAGIYETGLAGVNINSQNEIGTASSEGIDVGWGVSGSHSWRHTQIGVDYRGDYFHYTQATFFDTTNQNLMLGVKHQFTRHVALNLRNTAGMFSFGNNTLGLPETVPFDPSQSFIPTTDFFDNRTIYGSSIADVLYQRTARLSFDLGGGGFLARRASSALYGVTGATAYADVQYRLSRRTTIGANYNYDHFSFNHVFSGTDIHGGSGTYAIQLSRRLEFTGYAGFMRVETKFVQNVPVDPVVAAIIGITQGTAVVYSVRYVPNYSGRLSMTFNHGVAYLNGGHTVTPGNGLFLTTVMTAVNAGYTYTGLRRWSFGANIGYDNGDSVGNVIGNYTGLFATATVSRQVTRMVHMIASFSAQDYGSRDFSKYNRVVYFARVGIGFAPGDVPIRIW